MKLAVCITLAAVLALAGVVLFWKKGGTRTL